MRSTIYAELDLNGLVQRIIYTRKDAIQSPSWPERIRVMDYLLARSQLKQQVINNQNHECAKCGEYINIPSMHLHEVIHRGEGGEESLDNCIGLCAQCHIGRRGEHSDRQTRFGE